MTIGIAASGPRAGLAVIEGLKAAEAVGRGALHGFVSLVAIGADGRLHRAEIQEGGMDGILARDNLPRAFNDATCAGLMSSGPNRPMPLSQFTPADPEVGLVTGHRFPNLPDAHDVPLNLAVLDLMRQGMSPRASLTAVVERNPAADAGFIALSRDGRINVMNTPYLAGFGDVGRATGRVRNGTGRIAVVHNAIQPHRTLAPLVVEVALSVMGAPSRRAMTITLSAGLSLLHGTENAIKIGDDGVALCITVADPRYLTGVWSLGLGYRAAVHRRGERIATALYEPCLCAESGALVTIDGSASIDIPVAPLFDED